MPLTLDEMGMGRESDRASDKKDYLRHYHAFLNPWRVMPVRILETSPDELTRSMWTAFFADCDYNVVGTDPADILEAEQAEPFHLIVDSANKLSKAQMGLFARLFKRVVPGGYYCVENVELSLDKKNWGGKRGTFGTLFNLQKDLQTMQLDPAQRLVYPELSPRIDFVFTVPGLIVIRRNHEE
jgi:hypothetical protein